MKTYFLKSFRRAILKKPLIYGINFIGLSLSMAVIIILAVYYIGETNANKFNTNVNNIYVLCSKGFQNELQTYTPAVLKENIESKIPEVEKVVRMRNPWGETTFQVGEFPPVNGMLLFADSAFADVFTYQCLAGDFNLALKTPMSIVLTDKEALKLFGKLAPIGEAVKIDNQHLLTVRAVIQEPSLRSSLTFDAIAPMISIGQISPNGDELSNWMMANFTSFILTKGGANIRELENKIAALYPEKENSPELTLQPYRSFYFSDINVSRIEYLRTGNKTTTSILGVVAAIILLIGIINYLNLSFSIATERLKNTGIIKFIGAERGHIIQNIIGETVAFFFVSILTAYFLVWMAMPIIAHKIGIELFPEIIFKPAFFIPVLLVTLLIAILAVIVPALKLSSVNPIDSIKRNLSDKVKTNYTRRALVIAQFTVAIILIACTWAVQKQVKYGFKQLGYNNENIYSVQLTPQLKKNILKEKLELLPEVTDVAFTNYLPGRASIEFWSGMTVTYKGEQKENISSYIIRCDNNFPRILGLKPVEGRLFSQDLLTDKDKIIVNRTFVNEYGLNDPIGVKIPGFGSEELEIVGVVEDFHFQSVHKAISPVIIRMNDYAKFCYVKIASVDFNSLHRSVTLINELATGLSNGYPVDFEFLDGSVEKMYKSEVQFRKIFFFFSVIAILICCLGILGLSIFASQQRVKEIGIRKVNGAKVSEILAMLNKDFIRWVLVAFVIATPIAYFSMHKWLENFAYKTSLSWWIFALAGLLALGIALLTVSWQSLRAATQNPVEALRYE